MTVWVVLYDSDIQGAFKTKEDAYNFIVEDFTDSNKPQNENNPYYYEDMEWFERELEYLKEEYDANYSSFSCADHWYAAETELN